MALAGEGGRIGLCEAERRGTSTPPRIRMTGSSAYKRDPRVDEYSSGYRIGSSTSASVRDLIHGADPEVTETIKRTVQPYSSFKETSAPSSRPRTTSTSSSTTTASSPTQKVSSPPDRPDKTARPFVPTRRAHRPASPDSHAQQIIADDRAGGGANSSATTRRPIEGTHDSPLCTTNFRPLSVVTRNTVRPPEPAVRERRDSCSDRPREHVAHRVRFWQPWAISARRR